MTVQIRAPESEPRHRFLVRRNEKSGWEIQEARGSEVVRTWHYDDWHRVERALSVFNLESRRIGENATDQ